MSFSFIQITDHHLREAADQLTFGYSTDYAFRTVLRHIALPGSDFAQEIGAVNLGEIWQYVGVAGLNALCYAVFALAVGMLLFQSRELGGAEG